MKFYAIFLGHFRFVVSKGEEIQLKKTEIRHLFQPKSTDIVFLYSLEAPPRGASNEYPQHMFSWRSTKRII